VELLTIFGTGGLVILGLMFMLWIISLILKDSSIVDIFWGAGFAISGWVYFSLTPDGFTARKWLIVLLVTIWGLRLSLHILFRNWGKREDYRYRNWREAAGDRWWWLGFFKVFLLQGLLMWIISFPLLAGQISPVPDQLTWLDYAGVVIWGIGFTFEALGDWQLSRFRSDPSNQGQVLQSGVWRFTRHPNYFGDAVQWWGLYLITAAAGGYWAVFSPLLMTYLLVRVSGVAMLERALTENKPGYREYIQRTSAFIPWFPKRTP